MRPHNTVSFAIEADLKQFHGEGDYVHLLVHYPPKVQLSKLVNSLKGVSARLLRKEYDAQVRRYGEFHGPLQHRGELIKPRAV